MTNAITEPLKSERKLQRQRTRRLALMLVAGAIISTMVTYGVITRSSNPFGPSRTTVYALIGINLLFVLALGSIIAGRAYRLWKALRAGSSGSRLQTRIVTMFSLVSIIPTIIMLVFSAVFFQYGIQSWFDDRVRTALEESIKVAKAYVSEHRESIRSDAIAMAADLNRELPMASYNPAAFNQQVEARASLRSLTEAVVFERNRTLARTRLSFSLAFERLPTEIIQRANSGEIVVITDDGDDKVRAVVKLDSLVDTYLLVGRLIDSKVMNHVATAQGAVDEYMRLRAQISSLQLQFTIMFVVVSLLLLLVAIWYGMVFAARLMGPITKLVEAAERVREGDFSVRLDTRKNKDEIGTLARAFNRMTGEVEAQRAELIEANRELDERRRFTEAVLSGVSTGVVALDKDRRVRLFNRSADFLLALSEKAGAESTSFEDIFTTIDPLLNEAEKHPDSIVQEQLGFSQGGAMHTLNVKVTAERLDAQLEGFVVTFDDITELVSAQRSAAWADVARRVAHEIKNPLTPIALAAERLRKKYLPQVQTDTEAFLRYTETISKHVKDIGRMVEEFVSFARMPAPLFRAEDIVNIIRKSVFSEQVAHADIAYQLPADTIPAMISCDERQVSQLMLNLLKNAAEALDAHPPETGKQIEISLRRETGRLLVEICDNGPGFPAELLPTITEPYVTTRPKGSGLGLAIAKKTMEDHKGTLQVHNSERGACVLLTFISDVAIVTELR